MLALLVFQGKTELLRNIHLKMARIADEVKLYLALKLKKGQKMFALKGKNQSIELIRIFACLLVIMAHSQIGVLLNGSIMTGRLGMSTMIADDVPLFLLVTGFYFFSRVKSDLDVSKTFLYKVKSFLGSIYIPTVLYILISIFFRYFTASNINGIENADWDYLVRFVFRLAPGDHLWYICTYMSFVFFFPMLAFLCQDTPERNKLRRILLGIAIACAVIADVQYFLKKPMFDIEKFIWGYCMIFLVLGFELSIFIRKFSGSKLKLALSGLGLYLFAFVVKYGLQVYMFTQYGDVNNRFRWLQCTPCFMSAIGLFLVIYSIGCLIKKDGKLAYVVNFFGSCTFAIYLFHQLVIGQTRAILNELLSFFGNAENIAGAFGYYYSYALTVFMISFVVGLVFKLIVDNSVGRLFKCFAQSLF